MVVVVSPPPDKIGSALTCTTSQWLGLVPVTGSNKHFLVMSILVSGEVACLAAEMGSDIKKGPYPITRQCIRRSIMHTRHMPGLDAYLMSSCEKV